MTKRPYRNALRWTLLPVCAALTVSLSNVCKAQRHVPISVQTDPAGAIAVELLSHTQANSHDQNLAVLDGRKLNETRQFFAAALLELLAVRLSDLTGHAIRREPFAPDPATVRSDTLKRVLRRPGVTWGIYGAKVIGDSLVVQVGTSINHRTQPRSWSSLEADYYMVWSDTAGWRVADIRTAVISDGGCRPGSPDPVCIP